MEMLQSLDLQIENPRREQQDQIRKRKDTCKTAGRARYAGCFLTSRVRVNCRKSNFSIPARA